MFYPVVQVPPRRSERFLKIIAIARNQRTFVRRVRPSLPSYLLHEVLTLCGSDESDTPATTISTLPDDVLLDIFDFCRKDEDYTIHRAIHCLWDWNSSWNSWEWRLLVHVCRRWRQIVFASPRRLNLRIHCTRRTLVGTNLGIWPALPIDVDDHDLLSNITQEDNILAALKHLDRVYHVRLSLLDSQVEKMATAMQEPFPVLKRLFLTSAWHDVPALPAKFLGGSAPSLQAIGLCNIPYPALPTLLLSTSDLVKLDLRNIPPGGHISPEAMVASLAALPKLEIFVMEFDSHIYRPDQIGPPPVTRTILPALAYFVFRGASEYLEDLVGRIDGPSLNHISISTLYRPVGFQIAQLSRFIDQSVGPKLAQCRHTEVSFQYHFFYRTVTFNFCHRPDDSGQDKTTIISYEGIGWEAIEMLRQFPVTLTNVVHLQITCSLEISPPTYIAVDPSIQWFQLIRQFSGVQTLLIDSHLSGFVASILGHIPEVMMTEALPSLELLCLDEYCRHSVQVDKFVATRQHADRPVIIVNTNKEFRERLESYIGQND
jgi:hypothetical protein